MPRPHPRLRLPSPSVAGGGQGLGPVLIVDVKDPAGNISRWIGGLGNDQTVLLSAGG